MANGTVSTLPSPDPVVQITIPVSIKLDRNNFLTWRSQIEPIIDGFGLAPYLNASVTIPDKKVQVAGQLVVNPVFLTWHKQDRLLLGWLRSTITGTVLSHYVSTESSAALWTALHQVYLAVSSARIMELRRLLQTTTRGGQSCNEFFETMRHIADQLATVGEPMTNSDLSRYILNGLGPEYNSFVITITTRAEPLAIADLHSFLLTHENLLNTQSGLAAVSSSLPSSQNPTA